LIDKTGNGWILNTKRSAYVIGLSDQGHVVHRYWGERLSDNAAYPVYVAPKELDSFNLPENRRQLEFSTAEGADYREPCLCAKFPDGVRDVRLRYVTDETHDNELIIHLKDQNYEFHVKLHYQVYKDTDVIEKWVEITHNESTDIELSRVFSGLWHLPSNCPYRLHFTGGKWFDEMKLYNEPLLHGKKVLESRRITSGHNGNPWLAVDDGSATEYGGNVWFLSLSWSGNWKNIAEVTENGFPQILNGINDWDFVWRLKPGEVFVSPRALGGFSSGGFHSASSRLHDFIRTQRLPHGKVTRKVLFNSWEATTFDVDVKSQIELAKLAAEMGVELFVLDDGWFHGRKNDQVGLGDWWPDECKFPDGLSPLIAEVKTLGMDFGLWIEPEMVNPDSDLYRQHPDWVLHYPGRERTLARNQLILNMGRDDVQEYLISVLDSLLESNDIRFIKWDMNRNVSEPGWPGAGGDAREIWVRYTQGVYRVWETLRMRHPQVIFQSCSGGGGRADMGVLEYADQIWVSDNTEATARLSIQENFLKLFPAATMESWVTDQSAEMIPLDFRFHVSMCGVLGIGGNIAVWSDNERQEAAYWIGEYKKIRHIIHWGRCYLLKSVQGDGVSAVMYMSEDKQEGVIFVFQTSKDDGFQESSIPLMGMEEAEKYEILGETKKGEAWLADGLYLELLNFESRMISIKSI
jgi:alpha-galactosidase